MTTFTPLADPPVRSVPVAQPVTFGRLVAAERIKLRTLRSTWWSLLVGVAFLPAFAAMRFSSISTVPEAVGSPYLVGAVYVTSGVALAQLVFCTLGVLSIAGEYSTGQIRSTLTAAPRRLPALWAKLLDTVAVVMVASLLGVALAWAAGTPWFERTGMSIDPTRADDLRILWGVPLYLGAATALAFGIGAIVRSSAAGIATVLGLLLVLENGLGAVPWAPLQTFASFLPASAGNRLLQSDAVGSVITTSSTTTLSPWEGYGVMLAWVAVVLVAASVLLRRRDA
ncbi:ABC transporter permease [Cellulomonas hominis]|uniref:ABC transporter permease n=1 Tax=Cellulomonas hominis TaxID=156981 RepID=UPI001443DFC8|nr:ABC transporter permease subunit [Cellulomonas hominis]NKY09721.1 ABC transporter permease subunit [Cellulomonas hominis]